MKNLLFFSLLLSTVFACQKEQLAADSATAKEKAKRGFRSALLDYQSYIQYGQLHNDYLTNTQGNFTNSTTVTTLEGAIDYVADFNKQYTNAITTLSMEDKTFMKERIEAYKDFVVQETFMETQVGANGTVYQDIRGAYANGSLDEFEKNALIEIAQKSYDAYTHHLSVQDLEIYFNNLKTDWEAQQYTTSDVHGRLVPAVIALSLSSIDWWSNHPEAYPTDPNGGIMFLPIANDVAGAVVGGIASAVTAIVNDDIQGGGTLEDVGRTIATATVSGAVMGSIGAISKVASFIKSFF